jgi:hypothetical protein
MELNPLAIVANVFDVSIYAIDAVNCELLIYVMPDCIVIVFILLMCVSIIVFVLYVLVITSELHWGKIL